MKIITDYFKRRKLKIRLIERVREALEEGDKVIVNHWSGGVDLLLYLPDKKCIKIEKYWLEYSDQTGRIFVARIPTWISENLYALHPETLQKINRERFEKMRHKEHKNAWRYIEI